MTKPMGSVPLMGGTAKNGRVRLAYEAFGPATGEPLLLIMGVGMQMLLWHDEFCHELVKCGFRVARMDNRDVGLSTHLHKDGRPSVFKMIIRPKAAATYSLRDMAADCLAVLDDLGWTSAHIVGGSMGGMIAQTMAIFFPERVRSLTSIMSAPSPRIGRSTIRTAMKVAKLMSRPLGSVQEASRQIIDLYKVIGTPVTNYPLDEEWLSSVAATSYSRAYDPAGRLRQQAAMLASGDRRKELSKIGVPALVMHGDADPLIRLQGGQATAEAIPGSRFVVLAGVGHGAFPRQVWSAIIDNICMLRDRTVEIRSTPSDD